MQYKPKKTSAEEVEVIEMTPLEYQSINDFYKISLLEANIPVPVVRNANMKKFILTDGIYRKEFLIRVVDTPVDREKEARLRREYLKELLDEKSDEATKEYNELLNS